jgi:hypothetical protein
MQWPYGCLLALILLAKADAAIACSYLTEAPHIEKSYARASAVFVGRLVRVEETGVDTGESRGVAVEGTLQVVEVLKGQPPPDSKIQGPTAEGCGPVLIVGWDYLFFLDHGSFVPSPHEAFPLGKWQGDYRKHLLDKLGAGKKD